MELGAVYRLAGFAHLVGGPEMGFFLGTIDLFDIVGDAFWL
jgi:hypothetical protein